MFNSYYDVVADCDSFPYPDDPEWPEATAHLYRFLLLRDWTPTCTATVAVGYLPRDIVDRMPWTARFAVDHAAKTVTLAYFAPPAADATKGEADKGQDGKEKEVGKEDIYPTPQRPDGAPESAAIAEQLAVAREKDAFAALRGWRDELYAVLGTGRDVRMERAGSALFGIHTLGVHMTCYTLPDGVAAAAPEVAAAGGESAGPGSAAAAAAAAEETAMKIWVPRRAATKSTFPSMLDNSVAGGLAAGERPFECLVREAAEEASLPAALTRRLARPAGTFSIFHVRDARCGGELGLLHPETEYAFDMRLPGGVVPRPGDNEVAGFELWSVAEVKAGLMRGEFKPNCAVCLVDFFVRWGFVGEVEEKRLLDTIPRMHRRISFM